MPRPPRRIPASAVGVHQRTSIQPAPRFDPEPPSRPPAPPAAPRRRRFRLLVLVLVVLLCTGAGAAWMIQEERSKLDPAKVLAETGPAVVRVLASTCGGTGQAAGVRLGDDLVLTAASAIRGPVSVGVETTTGQVRRATVLGVSAADGIAVLRVVGVLQGGIATPAPDEPGPGHERAILGYAADGTQTVQPAGPSESAKPLTQLIGEASLGAPLLDNQGRVVGLVTGDTVAGGKVVPLDRLRSYLGERPPVSDEPMGQCEEARGPQTPQTPVLTTARTPLAGEVTEVLTSFINRLNQHDLRGVRALHTAAFRERVPLDGHIALYRTSYVFGARIGQVTDGTLIRAEMDYTILHAPIGPIGDRSGAGVTCSRWELNYVLTRIDGKLQIYSATGARRGTAPWRNCDA